MTWSAYNDKIVKDICFSSGSKVTKRTYSFLRRITFFSKEKVLSEVFEDKSFYFALLDKNHCRLIELAVKEEHQNKGLGKTTLNRLLLKMKQNGIKKMTFRTPIDEKAIDFWLHIGAKIIGLKDNDYYMELNIM